MESLSSIDNPAPSNRKCHPIVIPQFLLVSSSIISLAASCHLLGKPAITDSLTTVHAASPSAAAGVNITTCMCTVGYRILFQVALRYGAQDRNNRPVHVLRSIARYEQGAMAGVVLAWAFNCVFLIVGSGVQQADPNVLAWNVVRLAATCLALLAACSMFLFLEERRWNRKHRTADREEKSEHDPECPPAPRIPFLRSTSFLSAKPSLSTISSATRSCTSKSSSISKSSTTVSYTPFPPPNRLSHSSVSSFPHHPRLKRVSSAPSLPQIPSLPPIETPARMAPSSISTVPRPQPIHPSQHRRPQQIRRCSSQTISRTPYNRRSIPSIHRTTSPLSIEAATFPGANMASVRRARSRSSRSSSSSGSSASARRSRLRIMETVSEPEEDTVAAEQGAIPAVPQLDVTKWTHAKAIHVRQSKLAQGTEAHNCHVDAPVPRKLATKRMSAVDQRVSSIPTDRPFPPLPLVVVKKIHSNSAQHVTPAPMRASSRISKVASIVRSKSAATARSVASVRVKRPRQARLSAHLREEALGSPIQGYGSGVDGEVAPSRRAEGLRLQLEDRDLFRLSVLESIKVVGV